MHLKSLTLKGFKSFASATTLKFEPGICAVVGPNGSGKSNVVDALAWVMGEHSAKTLRGGKMDDVIFAGAGDRKALGRAEVTLTIDNSDGALDIEFTEVSVTRRMFRDGASEYEINGHKARLIDIQELLSDSGIGREMHVIVGQGRLAQILESRPEERRAFIEEAAGVLKHKRRKEKAQRKLVNMQANLDRLTDLSEELSRQLGPLARQAKAASRAATVQADLRDARLKVGGYHLHELAQKLQSATTRVAVLSEQVDTATEVLQEASATHQELEQRLEEILPEADRAQNVWFELSKLSEQVQATLRIATERASSLKPQPFVGQDPVELRDRAQHAEEELGEAEEHLGVVAERLETIREEVAEREYAVQEADREHVAQLRAIADRREGVVRLLAQEENQRQQLSAVQAEIARREQSLAGTLTRVQEATTDAQELAYALENLRGDTEALQEAHLRAQTEAATAEQRYEQLRSTQQDLEKQSATLQSRIETLVATAPRPAGEEQLRTHGSFAPLAQFVAAPGLDKALAAVLTGTVAEALVGELDTELIDALSGAGIGRSSVVTPGPATPAWHIDAQLPPGAQWLIEEITCHPEVQQVMGVLLADVIVVPTVADGRKAVAKDQRLRAVTPQGVVVGAGWVSFGSGGTSGVEVAAQVEEAEKELEVLSGKLEEITGAYEGARTASDEARVRAAHATSAMREAQSGVERLAAEHKRAVARLESAKKEHENLAQEALGADKRLDELRQALDETTDRLARVEDEPGEQEPSTEERDQAQQALAQVKAMEMEARLSLRSAEEKVMHLRGKGEALRRQAEHEQANKERHEAAQQRRAAQAAIARVVRDNAEKLLGLVDNATRRASQARDEKQRQRAQVQADTARAREYVGTARTQVETLSAQAHTAEVTRSAAQVRYEEAGASLVEQLGIPLAELLEQYAPGEEFDLAAEQTRLKRAERDLQSLGKVNPLAMEEYKALEERYQYLATQLSDVEQARSDLHGVIEDVDAKILQLFTDAWHDVEREFPKVFHTLFPGGEGRLLLTDPEDILTTGIEVEARPPGKKVKRLSLLSGGEKSLTALALLVAIFRARPSPFYVMDEVEAALDDVNLRRLIALFEELRQDSQLIVITHQKPTMDVANVLYGVTMRGDGVTRVISQRMSPATT